ISGVIVLELENGLASSKLSRAMIMTSVRSSSGPTTPGSMGQSAWSKIGPDGSFRLAGLPAGTAALYLGGSDSIAGSMNIVRIERDGIVLPRGIEIGERDQINGLRVVVSYGSATLRGQVVIQNGTVPPGGSIFVRLNRPGDPTLGPRHPLVDSRGHFIAEGVPPGTYEITTSVIVPGARPTRPPTKQQVTLQDGATTDVVITIDLGERQ